MFLDHEKANIKVVKNHLKDIIKGNEILAPCLSTGDGRFLGLEDVVIAGGFFTNSLRGVAYKDIDIFILNNNENLYNNMIRYRKNGVDHDWVASTVMNYAHMPALKKVVTNNRTKAQYILTTHKTRQELIASFDFVHTKVSYMPNEDKMYISREVFDCIDKRKLKINNNEHIQAWRQQKFIKKGWKLDPVEQAEVKPRSFKNLLLDAHKEIVREAYENQMGSK